MSRPWAALFSGWRFERGLVEARGRRYPRCGVSHALGACVILTLSSTLSHATSDVSVDASSSAPLKELRRAIRLGHEQRVDEAVALLERLVVRYPKDPAPHNELAVILAGRGDLDRAYALLVAAIEGDSRYALVYRNLQTVLGAMAGRVYEQALTGATSERSPPALASLDVEGSAGAPIPSARSGARAARPGTDPVPAVESAASVDIGDPPARVDGEDAKVTTITPAAIPSPPPPIVAAVATRPDSGEIASTVTAWARAWSRQDVEAYLSFYGHHFTPGAGLTRAQWSAQRRQRLVGPKYIEVVVAGLEITVPAPNRAHARFTQSYRSNVLTSTVTKVLRLSRSADGWKIVGEAVEP